MPLGIILILFHNLKDICDSPGDMGHSPEDMGHSPEDMSHSPEDMSYSPGYMSDSPEDMGHSPEDMGHSPEDMSDKQNSAACCKCGIIATAHLLLYRVEKIYYTKHFGRNTKK